VAVHTSLAERIPRGPYTCLHITGEDPWRKLRTPQQQSLWGHVPGVRRQGGLLGDPHGLRRA